MSEEMRTTTEKKCPQCGCETVAWISSEVLGKLAEGQAVTDKYECRRCALVFIYQGVDG